MKLQKEIEKLFDFELIPSKEGFKKIFEILLEKFYSGDTKNRKLSIEESLDNLEKHFTYDFEINNIKYNVNLSQILSDKPIDYHYIEDSECSHIYTIDDYNYKIKITKHPAKNPII